METFSPAQFFLRVDDKFYPDFVKLDRELRAGPSFLYVQLFRLCRDRDRCVVAQAELAASCKCSVRSIQNFLRSLVRFEYVRIEPREDGPNAYVLLLSSRIRSLLRQAGIEAVPRRACPSPVPSSSGVKPAFPSLQSPTQHFREGGEKFAPSYIRDQRDQDPPLSPRTPLPSPQAGDPSSASSGQRGGVSSVRVCPAQTHPDAETLKANFETLWNAWPRKQDQLNAFRAFRSLLRSGQLPALDELLAVVNRFKAEDRAWRNGCVPNLRFWLQGQRWNDEIAPVIPAPARTDGPGDPAAEARIQASVRAVQEKFRSEAALHARGKDDELCSAADAHSHLWPELPRGKILARLITTKVRGGSLTDLAHKALSWRGTPPPVEEWFSQAVAC